MRSIQTQKTIELKQVNTRSPNINSSSPKRNILSKVFTEKDDWVTLCNKIAGFAFFPLAPAAIAGVVCSNLVKDTSKPAASSLVHNIAYLHPFTQLIFPFIELFLSLLSASLCRIQPFSFLLPLGIWNALNELKALKFADQIRDLQEEKKQVHSKKQKKSLDEQINNTQEKINDNNSLLGFFTRVLCINLLFPPTYIVRLANVSGDTPLGKDLATTPLKATTKNRWKLLKSNLSLEWQALNNALKTVFTPSTWRGTVLGKNEKINKIIREKNYGPLPAFGLRLVGGSLKTALCLGIIFSRYIASALFLISLPVLGLRALNEGSKSYTKKDESKANENKVFKFIFDLANKFSVLGMWLNGIVPLMAITPSSVKSAGLASTIATTMFGILSLLSGLSDFFKLDPVMGRSFFYMGKGFSSFSNALSNLYRIVTANKK